MPFDRTLPLEFEHQAARTPDAIAVVCSDAMVSYLELNQRANRLAHHLIARSVRPDTIVAVALERSPEMVTALLAIVKAGGVYLPLDMSHPTPRLRATIEDAAAGLVIGTVACATWVPESVELLPLDLVAFRRGLRDEPDRNPEARDRLAPLSTRHAAYVIYTSGST